MPLPVQTLPAKAIVTPLMQWFHAEHRTLPWRGLQMPTTANARRAQDISPYATLVSEFMLQQTTVATVIPRFERFMVRFPTLESLASSPLEAIMHEWQGLGYYARARNLHRAAQYLVELGYPAGMPRAMLEWAKVPGVGPYTSAMLAAVANHESVPVVDTNVERVVARWGALAPVRTRLRAEVTAALAPLVPTEAPGDFAQAVMELGALVCRARKPLCSECPVAVHCTGKEFPERFPPPKPKRERPHKSGFCLWLENEAGEICFVKRPGKGIWRDLWTLPLSPWGEARAEAERGHAHGFTHFTLDLRIVESADLHAHNLQPFVDQRWMQVADALDALPLPSMMRRMLVREGV